MHEDIYTHKFHILYMFCVSPITLSVTSVRLTIHIFLVSPLASLACLLVSFLDWMIVQTQTHPPPPLTYDCEINTVNALAPVL